MSILASLVRAYDRLPNAPPFGYSTEKIGFVISLNEDGTVANVADLRHGDGKKKQPRLMAVPASFKRPGITPRAFFLWDNSAYVLGVSENETKGSEARRLAFKDYHLTALADASDEGLCALRLFLERWDPKQFASESWPEDIKDQNIIFALEMERRQRFLHERSAAKELWASLSELGETEKAACLVSGQVAPIARLHSAIKGVWGGQVAGGSIVSFNLDAFTSYGHEQGNNAPVSELAAFKYTTTLNRFLERDSGHRIQIGDASTVFWADASGIETAELAEGLFGRMFGETTVAEDDSAETKKIANLLERLRRGEQLESLAPGLAEGVRFHVLGLAPNAARISIRFHYEDDFGRLAENYLAYVADMAFEPRSKDRNITIFLLTLRTAPARRDRNNQIKFDRDQISPLLSGELFRAILTGNRFPGALLAQLLMRVRSDHVLDSLRVSMIKAIIVRKMRHESRLPKEDYLVRSDPDDLNPARRLGKLFALIERAQLAALGDKINTTVKDKFLGTCAATPAQVFNKLLLNAEQHHLKRLRNGHSDAEWIRDAEHARRVGAAINRDIGRLAASFGGSFPAQHSDEEQGLFIIGYYQERFGGRKVADDGGAPVDDDNAIEVEGEN